MKKYLAILTAVAFSSAVPAVNAQFTAVVVPPKKPKAEETAPAAATAKAARDTALSEKLTDMKAWVDSAAVALAAKPPTAAADSALPPSTSATAPDSSAVTQVHDAKPHAESSAKFRNGAPAPDTATPIPLLILAGAGLIAAGSWIRRR